MKKKIYTVYIDIYTYIYTTDMCSFPSGQCFSFTFRSEVFVDQEGDVHFPVHVSIENSCEFSRVSVSFSTFRAVDVLVS